MKIYGENAIWNKYVLSFLRKIAKVTVVFKVMGISFQTLGAATEKACLPKLSFLLGTICCEIDYQSCLEIFQRCRRLAKKGGCCVDRARYVRVDILEKIKPMTMDKGR